MKVLIPQVLHALKKSFAGLFLVSSCVFFSPSAFPHNDSLLEQIKQKEEFKVCSESGYLPMEMRSVSGKWYGIDPEMMEYFVQTLNHDWHSHVELVMVDTKWDGIIPSLLSGKCDAIASSMAMTPERTHVLGFSDAYFNNSFRMGMRNTIQNRRSFQKVADLNKENITIAVRAGSATDIYLQKSAVLKRAKILRFDTDADTVHAVLFTHKADCYIYDAPYVKISALNYPGRVYVLPKGFGSDQFGVGFRKKDIDLIQTFNRFIRTWKKEGGYSQTFNKYLDTSQWMPLLKK